MSRKQALIKLFEVINGKKPEGTTLEDVIRDAADDIDLDSIDEADIEDAIREYLADEENQVSDEDIISLLNDGE